MLAFYIDPKVIDTSNYFDEEISRYVDFIRETKPIAGVDSVLVPGDPERKMRAERTKNGVPLPDDTWAAIVNTAREVGVSEASIQRAASYSPSWRASNMHLSRDRKVNQQEE